MQGTSHYMKAKGKAGAVSRRRLAACRYLDVFKSLAGWFAILSLSAVLLCLPAFASVEGSLRGHVLDQSTGEALRKVKIILRPSDLQAVTDDHGFYHLEGIPAGSYTLHVSTIGYRLLKKEIRLDEGSTLEIIFYLGPEGSTIHETVQVTAPVFEEIEKTAPSQIALTSSEIKNLAGVLIDDPMRSVQTLPGVATGDDFNSSYSVRGGGFENNGILVDGVLTHSLAHTLQGTPEPTGSIMIMNGDLVESMALYSGAFSAKYGDRTASFLDIMTREGSRDRAHIRVAVSGSNAAGVAEGPLDAKKKGAWIVSARKSYADYLIHRLGVDSDLGLGFGDIQGKVNYSLNSRHNLGASFIWGRSTLSRQNPQNRGITSIIEGINNAGVANFSWDWILGPKLYWESRVYLIRETFTNRNKEDSVLDQGHYNESAARGDLSWQATARHRFEFGFLSRYTTSNVLDRRYNYSTHQFVDFDDARGRYWQNAVYGQDKWIILKDRLTAIMGARMDSTGLTGQTVAHPRASLEWRWGRSNKMDAGWGIFSQFPEVVPVQGRNGDPDLRAEVARTALVGYERLLGDKARFRIELFAREESNLQRNLNSLFRLVNGKVTAPDINFRYDNALRGHARGFEVYVQRRSANRLTGWISYTYTNSQRRDLVTGEVYSSDCDQRHTINIYGSYRFSESWNMSLKTRLGSGFPYPGYFEKRGEDFYLTTVRNNVRLPFYSRVDLRVNKGFYLKRSKLSLFVEVLNVSNRKNLRYDLTNSVNSTTRKVSMSRDTLLPILPTAGFVFEF
jgi:outer membrane receptor for ferrienterochelin and colicin